MRLLEAILAAGIIPAIRHRLLRTIGGLRPTFALMIALSTIATVISIVAIVIDTLAMTTLVTTRGPIMTVVAVVPVVTLTPTLLTVAIVAYRLLNLRHESLWEAVFDTIAAVIVAEFVSAVTHIARCAHTLTIVAVHALALRIDLLAIGHDDAAIMLGVLQIVFRKHRITRRLGVARQGHIFFSYMSRSAPNFNVRAIGFEAARERIVVVAALAVVIVVIIAPPTTAAILLTLPHCPNGSRLT